METLNANGETHKSIREKMNGNFDELSVKSIADLAALYALSGVDVGAVYKTDDTKEVFEYLGGGESLSSSWAKNITDKNIPPLPPVITVQDVQTMQGLIDSGDYGVGQLFSLVSDRSIRRFEGGQKSRIISQPRQRNAEGYARMTSTKASAIRIRSFAVDATGFCLSINKAAPTYFPSLHGWYDVPVPSGLVGVEHIIDIWPANSADSGRVGHLFYLDVGSNQLTSLDVSGLTSLFALYASDNQLTSLAVSGLTSLSMLDTSDNQLTSLDVSGLTGIVSVNVKGNTQMTTLDLSGIVDLHFVDGSDTNLVSVDMAGSSGAGYYSFTSSSLYGIILKNTNIGTDALYTMLFSMLDNTGYSEWIYLEGSPCDGGSSLTDGVLHTGAKTEALALAKGYTLVI